MAGDGGHPGVWRVDLPEGLDNAATGAGQIAARSARGRRGGMRPLARLPLPDHGAAAIPRASGQHRAGVDFLFHNFTMILRKQSVETNYGVGVGYMSDGGAAREGR